MNYPFRNPHPFDMSNYLHGLTYEVGGSDFESEEKADKQDHQQEKKSDSYKLDWSFLHKNLSPHKRS